MRLAQKNSYPTFALSFTNLAVRVFLQGLLPLYPFLVADMGGSKVELGIFLSSAYTFMLAGTFSAGRLTPRFIKPRALLFTTLLPFVVLLGLQGSTTSFLMFAVFGCLASFFVGAQLCAGRIMLGYFSTDSSVSKNYSLLTASSLVATILGGLSVGPLLHSQGNAVTFWLFALTILLSAVVLLPLRNPPEVNVPQPTRKPFRPHRDMWLLLAGTMLACILIHVFFMTLSLMLKDKGWNISQISLLTSWGTAICLPVVFWWGYITRYSNARFLFLIAIACGLVSFLTLLGAGNYWLGLLGIASISMVSYVMSIPIMSLLFGWYAKNELPEAQAWQGSCSWLAAIIGYSYNGLVMQYFGYKVSIGIGVCIGILSFVLIACIRHRPPVSNSAAAPEIFPVPEDEVMIVQVVK